MFFRRAVPKQQTFEERLEALRRAGFGLDRLPDGRVKVSRGGCAARVSAGHIERAGWSFGEDIAALVDGGYQKFWRVGGDRKAPVLASQLEALHAFEEDLREALGLESLYNTSLGTTNDLHIYDRVEGRP
jgi:hypothetical protein